MITAPLEPICSFKSIRHIRPGLFREAGIRFALVDVDDTLTGRLHPDVEDWVVDVTTRWREDEGLEIVLISNIVVSVPALQNRIIHIAKRIGAVGHVEAVFPRTKPHPYPFKKAVGMFGPGAYRENICMIGDQLRRDMQGGATLVCRTRILVEPMHGGTSGDLIRNFWMTMCQHSKRTA